MKIQELNKFLKFTLLFQRTNRNIYLVGHDRMESDVEHSFQLALMAWYIVDHEKLPLKIDLVIQYSLIHDLPEVYAGDRHIFDTKGRKGKEKREEKAVKRIGKQFPKWKSFQNLINKYHQLSDPESKFVYALDKLLAPMNIVADGGRAWREGGITFEMIKENKGPKVAQDKTVENLFRQWVNTTKRHRKKLFVVK